MQLCRHVYGKISANVNWGPSGLRRPGSEDLHQESQNVYFHYKFHCKLKVCQKVSEHLRFTICRACFAAKTGVTSFTLQPKISAILGGLHAYFSNFMGGGDAPISKII